MLKNKVEKVDKNISQEGWLNIDEKGWTLDNGFLVHLPSESLPWMAFLLLLNSAGLNINYAFV